MDLERKCPRCGEPVTGNRNQIYCTVECRWRFGYEKVQAAREKNYPTSPCPVCGVLVTNKNGRRFCGPEHRIAYHTAKLTPEDRRRYQAQHKANRASGHYLAMRLLREGEPEEAKPVLPRRASLAEAQEHVTREVYG